MTVTLTETEIVTVTETVTVTVTVTVFYDGAYGIWYDDSFGNFFLKINVWHGEGNSFVCQVSSAASTNTTFSVFSKNAYNVPSSSCCMTNLSYLTGTTEQGGLGGLSPPTFLLTIGIIFCKILKIVVT